MEITIQSIKKQAVPILKKYGVSRASLFGSIVRGNNTDKSDIDILVKMPEGSSLFDMLRVKVDLEDHLGRKVDLVQYKAIKKPLEKGILSTQVPIL